jgi:hypothetical protein
MYLVCISVTLPMTNHYALHFCHAMLCYRRNNPHNKSLLDQLMKAAKKCSVLNEIYRNQVNQYNEIYRNQVTKYADNIPNASSSSSSSSSSSLPSSSSSLSSSIELKSISDTNNSSSLPSSSSSSSSSSSPSTSSLIAADGNENSSILDGASRVNVNVNMYQNKSMHGPLHDEQCSSLCIAQNNDSKKYLENLPHRYEVPAATSTSPAVAVESYVYTSVSQMNANLGANELFENAFDALGKLQTHFQKKPDKDMVNYLRLISDVFSVIINNAEYKMGITTESDLVKLEQRYKTYFSNPKLEHVLLEHVNPGELRGAEEKFQNRIALSKQEGSKENYSCFNEVGKFLLPATNLMIHEKSGIDNPKDGTKKANDSGEEEQSRTSQASQNSQTRMQVALSLESPVRVIMYAIDHNNRHGTHAIWLKDRLSTFRVLWVGIEDKDGTASVEFLIAELLKFNPELIIHIIVVEDKNKKINFVSSKNEKVIIEINYVDFLLFDSDELFDIMYVSVKSVLSKCLSLKFFAFASKHFRLSQPLIMVGHEYLFGNLQNDEGKIIPANAKKIHGSKLLGNESCWSYCVTSGENEWGNVMTVNKQSVYALAIQTIEDEVKNTFWLSKDCRLYQRIITNKPLPGNVVCSTLTIISFQMASRYWTLDLCQHASDAVSFLNNSNKTNQYAYEISQAIYFQVIFDCWYVLYFIHYYINYILFYNICSLFTRQYRSVSAKCLKVFGWIVLQS